MKTLILTIVGASIANIVTQGFMHSYWGRNCVEEVSRFFDSMSKHMRKQKNNASR